MSSRDLGFRDLGFRDLGFRDLGFIDLGFRDLGFIDLGFRDLGFRGLYEHHESYVRYLFRASFRLSKNINVSWSPPLPK